MIRPISVAAAMQKIGMPLLYVFELFLQSIVLAGQVAVLLFEGLQTRAQCDELLDLFGTADVMFPRVELELAECGAEFF